MEYNENRPPKPPLDKRSAMLKAESYCAYQERSQQEVRNKLYEWGLHQQDTESIITELILTNFLNEERFAASYVSGKFNIKRWGKIKIKQGLKLKKVPEKMIIKALAKIDYDDYLAAILTAAEKKAASITEKDAYKRKNKLITYLMGRGFEFNVISEVLKDNQLI
ncbi:regulatory protein RecX [Pedobacter antarcticus]|uniref:regulatory protein RecX n=1 Tax=Pedobacter antarcticus TaxID=34086 RepID=UPI0008804894|nr:regulatory protein RecX [Pedobacter antarcticus]SDM31794.1 regulatory protein [Pedobacter antarcticus]